LREPEWFVLSPRETEFFGMFAEVSANLILGARLMVEMLHDFRPERPRRAVRGDQMKLSRKLTMLA